MKRISSARWARAVALTLIGMMGSATRSIAAGPPGPPDAVIDLPAGTACDFPLRVEIWNNANRVFRVFPDRDGNVVRILTAGKGSTLAFTNLLTGEQTVLHANGAVEHVALNPDGSQTWVVTGHNVLILFPTDVPAGPSTTLYVGRLVFTVGTNGVFTLQSATGTATDICAPLQ
jgi:hypothetical protein